MFHDINKKVILKFAGLGILLLVFGGFVGWGISYGYYQKELKDRDAKILNIDQSDKAPEYLAKNADFQLYWKVWDLLREKYFKKDFPGTKLFYGSLSGMVSSLDDPYTVFLNPDINKKFTEELSGKFDGIGAEVGIKKRILTIVAPLLGSPAEKVGLRAGDKIISIDGKDVSSLTLDEAVARIRGKKGTVVKLSIYREGFKEPKDFSITRDVIKVESTKVEFLDGDIAKFEISSFSGDIFSSTRDAVQKILIKKPKGIILDLRNDPGGYLEAAVTVSSLWVEKGKPVVIEKFGDNRKQDNVYKAEGNNVLAGIPLVVLINEGSASASEIVAGALQDYGIGKIVGEKSYGKSSVQELTQLDEGSALKVTVAKWYTPNDHSIDQTGITPDVEVKLTPEDFESDKDPQLEKAIELLK
jgi:carboxyl-terminal processing protease